MQFVTICGGEHPVGCTTAQAKKGGCSEIEVPSHVVKITRDFYMSRVEVSQAIFQELLGFMPGVSVGDSMLLPVDSVSWLRTPAK